MIVSMTRRLLVFAGTVLAASVVIFGLLSVLPGDPAEVALGLGASPEELAAQRAEMGLDQPLVAQYLQWLGGLVQGDFGISAVTGTPVGAELGTRLTTTAVLIGSGMAVAVVVAVPLGVLAATYQRRPVGALLSGSSQVGIAVPNFLAGLLLITVFAVQLRWFPAGGWYRTGDGFGTLFAHLVLPALALGSVQGAVLARYVRSAVLDVMRDDWMRTARAKGLSPARALLRHGLRNAAVPVLTVGGVQLGVMLIGAVVIERVFVINGLGSMLLERIATRDMIAVQGIVLVLVLAVLLVNLVVDLVQTAVDPRLREAS
ncbi:MULTISPECIES: ABC transporter permease [Pseudonocardia]|uniref:Glutathione transport system permease protein GsiC n=2 Tax=Pseudonocardia TaxID=1847 RepID=A0A1Y2MT38_PSEAH|nr:MULTISPECIES: ABC transporter permease [Pseudonocardia]OSY38366.1 Glutathione transport system permease protein GsiC [Pseudonocardia autotrophica]TDN72589.1 peptide/nickel transport system permease protein [Pseudonocardia autotrophica]BBG03298.1 peptide ABC transporter [Pseudonocardia autotrophica]GEC24556.1 peptide ABC transporter [Pseudonocardia saturnea]